mgnify:CR=1 FL=1|tara:strand:- start:1165 stop:1344 length:180 start_codon:yes stop_codon:yes gene_type:complete
MTEQNQDHFFLHSKNKARIYEDKKNIRDLQQIKQLKKDIAADKLVKNWQDEIAINKGTK